MPWVRFDDQFLDNPKIASNLTPLGIALHFSGIVWSARNLTDGIIPTKIIPRLLSFEGIAASYDTPANRSSAEFEVSAHKVSGWYVVNTELGPENADVWHDEESAAECHSEKCHEAPRPKDTEFLIHDYLAYQPSKADVLGERSARSIAGVIGGKARAAQAVRDQGRFTSDTTSDSPATAPAEPPAIDQPPTSRGTSPKPAPVPVPVPVPKEQDQELNTLAQASPPQVGGTAGKTSRETSGEPRPEAPSPAVPEPPGFARWYAVYPLHQGRGAAAKAYRNARRRADADVLLDAVVRYASDPNLPTDRSKIPYPQKWLNEKRWLDEPLPERSNGQADPIAAWRASRG